MGRGVSGSRYGSDRKGNDYAKRRPLSLGIAGEWVRFGGELKADSAFLFHERGDGVHEIKLCENLEFAIGHFDENGGTGVSEKLCDTLDGGVGRNAREGFAHDFADDELAQVFALERKIQDLVFVDGTDRRFVFKDRKLGNVLLLHGMERMKNSLVGTRDDEFAMLAVLHFDADDIGGTERNLRFDVAVLAHPAVIINFAEIAHSGVGKKCDDAIGFFEVVSDAQCGGDASAAGASGENAFLLGKTASPNKTFFVGDL